MTAEKVETYGEPPNLVGLICEALLAEQYWHRGELSDSANVVWLRFKDSWYRLFFEFSAVNWRASDKGPEAYEMPELEAEVRIVDLADQFGLVGDALSSYEAAPIEGGSEVRFEFRSGKSIAFRSVNDATSYTA